MTDGRYRAGTKPLPDTCWQAFGIEGGHFKNIGRTFKVTGKQVQREMNKAHSIKGHTPDVLALRKASKKYGRRLAGVDRIPCKIKKKRKRK